MIGECDSLAPRKKTLNFFNLIMSLLAGIFMIVACASYSANLKTIEKLPFMTLTADVQVNIPGVGKFKVCECSYIGFQGMCYAECGSSQTVYGENGDKYDGKIIDLPSDSKRRKCSFGKQTYDANGSVQYSSSLQVYKTTQTLASLNKCQGSENALLPGESPGGVTINQKCDIMATCQNAGNTTMAFSVIGCITALLSMVAFAWRMNSDGVCPKVTAFVLAGVTFIACTTAFGAFQPCLTLFYNAEKQALAAEAADPNNPVSSSTLSARPGVGGALAVTSFVFFIYVMLMSIFIPSAESAGTNAGLDNKAPQV